MFVLAGCPPGEYIVSIESKEFNPLSSEGIFVEPSESLYFQVFLTSRQSQEKSKLNVLRLDYTHNQYQTLLDQTQIQELPSAHNVWSLVENQDLSATTNRIDVGGLWGTIPSLFSARGGYSWTQNTYQLNGMDVTDPYWTGKPLFYPDYFALRYTQLINAGNPPEALSPGGLFNLYTREPNNSIQGGISFFFLNKILQSSNVSPALEKEGIFESHSFNYFMDGNAHISGPLIPEKLFFFSSMSSHYLSRDLAEYDSEDKSSLNSGLLSFNYHFSEESMLRLLWTGQIVYHPSYGAERQVPFSSTLNRKEFYDVYQAIWTSRVRNIHFFKVGLNYTQGDIRSRFQEDSTSVHGLEIFRKIPSGTAPVASRDKRRLLTFLAKGESIVLTHDSTRHKFQYGLQLKYAFSSSSKEINENTHLHFFNGEPLEIVRYNTPVNHQEASMNWSIFAQDSFSFSNLVSFYVGFNISSSIGWVPEQFFSLVKGAQQDIRWINLSPRIGLIIPLTTSKKSAIKLSGARYYFNLPLNYLTYGNPNSLGALVYTWEDTNGDRCFQEEEQGNLLKREGPFYSEIDENLKRPFTDELILAYHSAFSSKWYFSLAAFLRETRNLIETINTGVPFSSYVPVEIFDIGDDRTPETHDDLSFIVYNQNNNTFGQDFFLLTNPDANDRITRYYGLDLILLKKYSDKFTFFLSLTATAAIGTTSPGNTEWENDDGVIGALYDNPNSLINAKGRVRFDRAYTGRLGFNYLTPFGIRFGCIIKYYDGQPFARKIIVHGFNQGPFYIQAHPRGKARYEYNRTIDIRIEKIFLLGKTKLRLILDGFNIINRACATEENEWTGPEFPLRFATEVQSPRVFRLGLSYEF